MINPLKAIIGHHCMRIGAGKIIIEGDGILPSLATQEVFRDLTKSNDHNYRTLIRTIFLVEDDKKKILNNFRKRGRGFNETNIEVQNSIAHASWLFGKWLCEEAQAHNLPILSSTPNETVVERFMESIN
ncbi:MAG: hypothetical protein JEZ06_12175 [Anaerolineaceae bacterium]|nr:hypothetical protein [Anaerolineaceae bacterium]